MCNRIRSHKTKRTSLADDRPSPSHRNSLRVQLFEIRERDSVFIPHDRTVRYTLQAARMHGSDLKDLVVILLIDPPFIFSDNARTLYLSRNVVFKNGFEKVRVHSRLLLCGGLGPA